MSRKLFNPSASRNRDAILQVLLKHIPTTTHGAFLEISSGTGMHVELFAPTFPHIKFLPSDIDSRSIESIEEVVKECPTKNICKPMTIDVSKPYTSWGMCMWGNEHRNFSEFEGFFDFMLNINMIHISEFACTEGLFENAGKLLKKQGKLFTYGPYAENGVLVPESNVSFDKGLRSKNADWGVRDIVLLEQVAGQNGIKLVERVEMPANNKCLIWVKD